MPRIFDHKLLLIVLLTVIVYAPGLSGGFLFDDFANLKHINIFSQYNGFEAFLRYIFSDNSGALKRPISTLSFLLNSTTWPANPLLFKLTNIMIHLSNGLLMFLVSKKTLALFKFSPQKINAIALLTFSIWVLHPFFVSTTLYVVQRMAMLPVTFMLLGFYFYLKGRSLIDVKPFQSRFYLFIAIYLCTILAVLSKENGIILPIVITLFEYIVYRNKVSSVIRRSDKYLFFLIPAGLVIVSFLINTPKFLNGYEVRDFTVYERVFTQARVLVKYLYHFFIPQYFTEGVFSDGIVVSKSFFKPLTTVTSIFFIFFLIFIAIKIRKKHPLTSFAILFFFVTNVIESTIVPLEMYFEHRAYMSLLFMPLPIAIYIINSIKSFKFKVIVLCTLLILPITTYFRADLWGDNELLTLLSVKKFPRSVRATENAAYILTSYKQYDKALNLLLSSFNLNKRVSLWLNYFNLKCGIGIVNLQDFDQLLETIKNEKIVKNDRASLNTTFQTIMLGVCTEEPIFYTRTILKLIKQKPAYQNIKIKQVVDFYDIKYLISTGKFEDSYVTATSYLNSFSAYDNVIEIIHMYIQSNKLSHALRLLLKLEKKVNKELFSKSDYSKQVLLIKSKIKSLKNQNDV